MVSPFGSLRKLKKNGLKIETELEEVKSKIRQVGWIVSIKDLHGENKLREYIYTDNQLINKTYIRRY